MPRTDPELSAELKPYLKRLDSWQKHRREVALAEARRLTSDQLRSLTTAATRHIEGIRWRIWLFNPIIWIILLMPATCGFLKLFLKSIPPESWAGGVIMTMVLAPVVGMFYNSATEPTRLYVALRDLIAEREDVSLLGPVLDLQRWGEVTVNGPRYMYKQNLLPAIERMVRRMEPGDYADLTVAQKGRLLRWLHDPFDHFDFSLALLEMLKTVSDKSAMDIVAQLARAEAATPRQKQLRAAAQECLASMKRVRAREQQAQLLLRASDANTVATSDILLRPAAETNLDKEPDQLLRAAGSDSPLLTRKQEPEPVVQNLLGRGDTSSS